MGVPGEDVQDKLDEIVAIVEAGKSVALSSTTVKLDRVSLLGALDDLRELLPREIADARGLLRHREIIQEAATEARRHPGGGPQRAGPVGGGGGGAGRGRSASRRRGDGSGGAGGRDAGRGRRVRRRPAGGLRSRLDQDVDARCSTAATGCAAPPSICLSGRPGRPAPTSRPATPITWTRRSAEALATAAVSAPRRDGAGPVYTGVSRRHRVPGRRCGSDPPHLPLRELTEVMKSSSRHRSPDSTCAGPSCLTRGSWDVVRDRCVADVAGRRRRMAWAPR